MVVATLALIIAGVAYLIERHYEQSFVKEMQDFIEGPEYVDKATNTEDVEESKSKEKPVVVDDLIDFSDEVQPPAPPPYEEVCPDSNLGSVLSQSNTANDITQSQRV